MLARNSFHSVAHTRPPAKLNLFLELLGKRDDGYHEIETVMVPIDWCDELSLRRTRQSEITLEIDWLPSRTVITRRLGAENNSDDVDSRLAIPTDASNLVHQALSRFRQVFDIDTGFACRLGKKIPAGAGMGGASSDAASALRCAAALCGVPLDSPALVEIAASIGSDVPYFLAAPADGVNPITAGRATGRGEQVEPIEMTTFLNVVVVYPGVSLSTGKVYADSRVPQTKQTACRLMTHLGTGNLPGITSQMMNRLTEPAKKLAPRIDEILESLWQLRVRTCQLTGSGSACFAIVATSNEARRVANAARARLEPGALVMAARSTTVPAPVTVT